MIAWTHSRRWHRKDRLDLDCFKVNRICRSTPANAPDPGDPSQRALQTGQLAAIRLGGNYDKRSRAASTRIDDADVAVNSGPYDLRTVVHSARLDDLVPGEVIEAGGTVDVTGHGYDHFGSSYWILARDPATAQAMTGTPDRYLSAMNGVNCLGESPLLTGKTSGYCSTTRQPPTLPIRQLGVGKVPRSAPSTMYLNYVVLAGDGSIPDGVTPSAHVDSGSFQLSCDPVPSAQPCSFARP